MKLENDLHDNLKAEKTILVVVLAPVVLVVISWAADGFAFNETRSTEHGSNLSQIFEYGTSVTTNDHSEDEHSRI